MSVYSHRDLFVWQKSMRLAKEALPARQGVAEIGGVSSDKPIATGGRLGSYQYRRGSRQRNPEGLCPFHLHARGSLAETETILLLLVEVELLTTERVEEALSLCSEIGRMLNRLHERLRALKPSP